MRPLTHFRHPTAEKAGLSPGTAVYVGKKRTGPIHLTLIDYDQDQFSARHEVEEPELARLTASPSTTWLNIDGLHEVGVVEKMGEIFKLHPLTVEDILNTRQRPKIELFDDYLFLVAKIPEFDEGSKTVHLEQISFILTHNLLLTFQEKPSAIFDAVKRRISGNKGRIRRMRVDYLAYALLDAVVDNFFVVLEEVGEEIEALEQELVEAPRVETMNRIHLMKREMILLRKSVWSLREMIGAIQRDEVGFFGEEIGFFLRDLYDHTIQVMDTVETFRDLIAGMQDIYLSAMSNRTNEVMKVLTIFAAIFIPQTLIAGIYGMNFNTERSPYNMPELNWLYGYPFALGLMLTIALAMLLFFKKKRWF